MALRSDETPQDSQERIRVSSENPRATECRENNAIAGFGQQMGGTYGDVTRSEWPYCQRMLSKNNICEE